MKLIISTFALCASLLGLFYSIIEQQNVLIVAGVIVSLTACYQLYVVYKNQRVIENSAGQLSVEKRLNELLAKELKLSAIELRKMRNRLLKELAKGH